MGVTAEANQTRVLGQDRAPKYFLLLACEPQCAGMLANTNRDHRPRGAVATGAQAAAAGESSCKFGPEHQGTSSVTLSRPKVLP